MTKVFRLALLLLSFVLCLPAQTSTVYQKIFTNQTTSINSSPVRNIGQTQHRFWGIWSNAPAQTCSAAADVIQFEGSFDNTNYFHLSTGGPVLFATNAIPTVIVATGTYPYIRVALRTFDTTKCILNGWYSGTFQPEPQLPGQGIPTGNNITNPIYIDITGATNVLGPLVSGMQMVVMEIYVWNVTAQTITFADTLGTTYFIWPACANCGVLLPHTGVAKWTFTAGAQLQINLSGSTRVTGYARVRFE